jgi:hypothetical protein
MASQAFRRGGAAGGLGAAALRPSRERLDRFVSPTWVRAPGGAALLD